MGGLLEFVRVSGFFKYTIIKYSHNDVEPGGTMSTHDIQHENIDHYSHYRSTVFPFEDGETPVAHGRFEKHLII